MTRLQNSWRIGERDGNKVVNIIRFEMREHIKAHLKNLSIVFEKHLNMMNGRFLAAVAT